MQNKNSKNEVLNPQELIELDLTNINIEKCSTDDLVSSNNEEINSETKNPKNNENKKNNKNIKLIFFKKHQKLSIAIIIFVVLIIIAVSTILAVNYHKKQEQLRQEYLNLVQSTISQETFYDGIIVCDINLSGKTKEEAKQIITELEPTLRPDVDINVKDENKTVNLNKDDFSFTYDTDAVIDEAYSYARNGEDENRYKKIIALKENPAYYSVKASINAEDTDKAVEKVYNETYIPAKNASITSCDFSSNAKFNFSEGQNGTEINKDDLKNKLTELLSKNQLTGEITALNDTVNYSTTAKNLSDNITLISKFSTVSTNTANANNNMSLALNSVNQTVLAPGDTFSFNSKTGNSNSAALGYLPAGAIVNGKITDSYGGGICQAATTIYGAAIRANMSIIERHNHAWKSAYVPIGLDATIDYPGLDLKFKNDSDYPVCICAYMSSTTLNCEFYGAKSNDYDNIDVVSNITETIPEPATKYETDYSLGASEEVVDTQGRTGYRAQAYKIFYKGSNEIKRESLPSSYYPAVAKIVKRGS